MKLLILATLPFLIWAQGFPKDSENLRQSTLLSQGQLVSLRLVKGEPLRIFVVGKEEAKVDFSNLSLTVRRMKPYPAATLKTDRYNNSFTITEPVNLENSTELEVTAKLNNQSEKFYFKLDKK